MCVAGRQPLQPLLPPQGDLTTGPVPDEGDGPPVPGNSFLRVQARVQADEGFAEPTRHAGKPEAGAAAHETDGTAGYLPAASHQPTSAGTLGLSLPAEGSDDHLGEPGMGGGHHLPAHGPGIPLPGRNHGLAQPVRGGLAIVQHSGDRLLCRGPEPENARRVQHRPGEPVHQPRVHADTPGSLGEDQHGWQRQVPGQHISRAAMEDGEVRGGLPEGLRQRP